MILLVLFICLIIAVGTYAALAQTGTLPWSDQDRAERYSGVVPRMSELNQGCLITLVVACIVWFAAWSVVLVLSLRFLRSVI